MYEVDQIRHVHLEISSRCNAACPLCPRNFYGYPFNDGYVERDLTLEEVKTIFKKEFLIQLNEIFINGNFGDAVMNPETVEIIEYFKTCNPQVRIRISTNGSARDQKFWQALAELKVEVTFCIDGLEDTHSLYRQNTLYSTVIKNAQIFIKAGGVAFWKMIDFEHNQHQQNTAERLSVKLGFKKFQLVNHGRNQGPVFDSKKNLVHVMGTPISTNFDAVYNSRITDEVLLEDIITDRSPKPIICQIKKQKSIYVSSTGEIYPCCFLGFSPKTYGHGNYHQAANAQLKPMIQKNNALEYDLKECIEWFNMVEKSWEIPTFEQGRLVICNDVCGQN